MKYSLSIVNSLFHIVESDIIRGDYVVMTSINFDFLALIFKSNALPKSWLFMLVRKIVKVLCFYVFGESMCTSLPSLGVCFCVCILYSK